VTRSKEGHDSGHPGCTWGRYVETLAQELGGFTALADLLVHKAKRAVDVPDDPQTVEKGIRRLARRGNEPGGQYGRWLLRYFGIPRPIEQWARWMGQYHSRFADLPLGLREAQLLLLDRPPVSHSGASCWIQIGLATVAHGRVDREAMRDRLDRARAVLPRAPAAGVEIELFDARVASDRKDDEGIERHLRAAEAALEGSARDALDETERACYRARLIDQRAHALLHPVRGKSLGFEAALAIYESIADGTGIPFVDFRRAHGRAYCLKQLGRSEEAKIAARSACDHAGDGGYVRFRIMGLELLARLVPSDEATHIRKRTARMARYLEDEDLGRRVAGE